MPLVNGISSMDVQSTRFGRVRDGGGSLDRGWPEGLVRALSRRVAQKLNVAGRCAIARSQNRLVGSQNFGRVLQAGMPFEYAHQAGVRPSRDLQDVVGATWPEADLRDGRMRVRTAIPLVT
jgi:hypothetical protein